MKTKPITVTVAILLAAMLGVCWKALPQTNSAPQKCEIAIVKWDGPDRLQFITPQKSEMMQLFKTGVKLPRDIHDEEFCLTWAANKLAQEGWEPVSIESNRILFRRDIH